MGAPKGVKQPPEVVAKRSAAIHQAWRDRNKEKIAAAERDYFDRHGVMPTRKDLRREYQSIYWKRYIPKHKAVRSAEYANASGRAKILLRNATKRSTKRGHAPPEITLDDVRAMLAPGRCAVSGLEFVYAPAGTNHPRSPSLDRIDSKLGYTKANTRAVCWAVNAGCANWGLDEYITIAREVIARTGGGMGT